MFRRSICASWADGLRLQRPGYTPNPKPYTLYSVVITLAITGASGSVFGQQLLDRKSVV